MRRQLASNLDDALQFSAGDDIEPRAQFRQQPQDRKVGVRFYRIADRVLAVREGLVELPVSAARMAEPEYTYSGVPYCCARARDRNAVGVKFQAGLPNACPGNR